MTLTDQLQHIAQSLFGFYPELYLVLYFLAVLILELSTRKNPEATRKLLVPCHWIGALGLLVLLVYQWFHTPDQVLFGQMLSVDSKAVFFKIWIALAWLVTLFHIQKLRYEFQPELYLLLSGAVLGGLLLCMATNLLTLYLGIEFISLCSYLLVGLHKDIKSSEGSLKYLLFGGISSAVMLYGISFLYGLTGTMEIAAALETGLQNTPPLVLLVTSLLTLGGLLFKLSLIPFHIWTPDTYEATPTPVVSFLSAVPKIGVLLVLSRLIHVLPLEVIPVLGGIALISMTAGNVGALWQSNARRLMAYSTIAQAGYLIVGLLVLESAGFHAATFYLSAYVILSMSAFLLMDLFAPQTDTRFSLYEGRGKEWPLGGAALTMVMVGLAGFPPTVGFTAKWLVFSSLWESYQGERWILILLIGGILNAAISLVYYLKIPYLLFFKKTSTEEGDFRAAPILAGLVVLLVLLLFVKPELILNPATEMFKF